MPVGRFYEEAVDRRPIRKFKRRKKLPTTGAKVVQFGSRIWVADKTDSASDFATLNWPLLII